MTAGTKDDEVTNPVSRHEPASGSHVVIPRRMEHTVRQHLESSAAVVLLGPRQIGKTDLAMRVTREWAAGSLYLDLERPEDLEATIAENCSILRQSGGRLVVLDEVHRLPGLFEILRGIVDDNRAAGFRYGQFLLLSSASRDLIHVPPERLTWRIAQVGLAGIDVAEATSQGIGEDQLWLRGGYPDSLLAGSDSDSLRWRVDVIRSYLDRDAAMFAPRIPAEALGRLWTMLAHHSCGLLTESRLAAGLGVDRLTVDQCIDLLIDLGLVRKLRPWHGDVGIKLVQKPKILVRDTGLLHALLDVRDLDELLGHSVAPLSFETLAVESLITAAESRLQPYHLRTAAGDEIDLLLARDERAAIAIEITRSSGLTASAGFGRCAELLNVAHRFIVTPDAAGSNVKNAHPIALDDGTQVVGLAQLASLLADDSLPQ